MLDLLAAGLSGPDILEEMPDLEGDDIRACVAYDKRGANQHLRLNAKRTPAARDDCAIESDFAISGRTPPIQKNRWIRRQYQADSRLNPNTTS